MKPSPRTLLRPLAAALLAAVCAAPPAPAGTARPPDVTGVRPVASLERAFASYAERDRSPRHWTGGDGTYSVPTAAGELWIFSDTFLGRVRPDGSRPPTPFVHNSFVLWDGTGPHTVTGTDRAGRPVSAVPEAGGDWYWARAGVPLGRGAAVVLARYARTGPGPLDLAWRANVLARVTPGRPVRTGDLTPLPSAAGIAWGAWLARDGDVTYVYGTEQAPGGGAHLHVARTLDPALRGPWRYRAADGSWSGRERDSARLTAADGRALRVSQELSVVRHGRWWALVAQRSDVAFGAEVQLAWSASPTGPFTRPRTVWRAPEAGPQGTYHNPRVIAYNPHEHPELEHGERELVISYNVNSLDVRDVLRQASVYRPRFVRVALGRG
ncbi:hypothetical protein [Streptomyces caatingaensis]|uniref:DUF4185 domain-containing protein n=1 Tax=Streptomyces caatingaensis TaxID=1678637 RepID=A0A0K9XD85_9ACTN|nr:hypothetical protein [Streptomyces caatingaensis]KNB50612.1 hypothetical protein AC230_22030 [Streptomyces caatingaensis]